MIIKEVSIKNFFCYLNENKFQFTEGLNIISGRNSSGKSQFFNAFYWTFFEQIYSEDNAAKKKKWISARNLSIYPAALAATTAMDGQFATTVEIMLEANDYRAPAFTTDDTTTYIFKRDITYKQTERGLSAVMPSELRIEYITSDGETEIINRAEHDMVLDKIFPKSIRRFMWYQGETMDVLYDFSNDVTLKNAINEISYFPKYDYMNKVVIASDKSINKKIEKELNHQNRLTRDQTTIYNDITYLEKVIESKESQKNEWAEQIHAQEDEMTKIEQKLEGMDHFIQYKTKLINLEAEQRIIKNQIDEIEKNSKERLINVWMLNGCENLIKASESKLGILNKEIQEQQAHQNPIPMNLPGPEYVEQMLKDKMCYICERPVDDDLKAYEALKKRLNEFEKNVELKSLQENFTDLNRFRKKLLSDLPNIKDEIASNEKRNDELMKKRIAIGKQINNVFSDLGFDERADLESNASLAQSNMQKHKTFRADILAKQKRLTSLEQELTTLKLTLLEKKTLRDGFTKTDNVNIVESDAAEYIKLFVSSIGQLKDSALQTLITELEQESNRLYALYLDGRQQGVITIEKGVQVIDEETKMQLFDLNQGEQVAQKLAVANAFLSLSAKKMNRSYPLIADAPSSDLDAQNTYNLTVNIGGSFEQIIIMSKDYEQFKKEDLAQLISDAHIETFYRIENEYIDPGQGNSRQNRYSVATKIK